MKGTHVYNPKTRIWAFINEEGKGRPIYEVIYNGKKYRVAITVGKNGFIVGANPVSIK
ncbi:hypothetical protein HB790_08970 [Listeria welshimeri]|uniref:hypothetical protein n=1 Tax=Listeria welshimeri TaxID=1643 RepID=UPI00162320FC|nr:hypothetical protein [Listeria welshimeri]MBC1368358.1 hypothetical protein [Listeria welshimeri]MBC1404721.1 hypothetical protein [Listeria welshimeri]MBC1446692.1 hypothetical protein [Listeria welshimeri]MBC1452268.1 hypothetical protein [Listeria welshimeri]MBC1519360.1 hypothetical protein [Listeria welshimeri]